MCICTSPFPHLPPNRYILRWLHGSAGALWWRGQKTNFDQSPSVFESRGACLRVEMGSEFSLTIVVFLHLGNELPSLKVWGRPCGLHFWFSICFQLLSVEGANIGTTIKSQWFLHFGATWRGLGECLRKSIISGSHPRPVGSALLWGREHGWYMHCHHNALSVILMFIQGWEPLFQKCSLTKVRVGFACPSLAYPYFGDIVFGLERLSSHFLLTPLTPRFLCSCPLHISNIWNAFSPLILIFLTFFFLKWGEIHITHT